MSGTAPTAKHEVRPRPFAVPHVFTLAAVDGPDTDAVYRVIRAETRIGRAPEADVILDDERVSKHHCTIRYDAGRCHLVDEGSLNGTEINGRPLAPGMIHRLRHLDEIQIGETRLLFMTGRCKQRSPDER